ncbi:MAG: lactate utilization protein [Candidatus Bathyarchaeota archaeon]
MSSPEEIKKWFIERRCELTIESLKKNGFNALYVARKEDACNALLEMIPLDKRIGVAGSSTLREIGVVDALAERGNQLYDTRMPNLSREDILKIRQNHLTCDIFISSSNAITTDGKLINADGAGNRVAAMIFGPPKVIVVAGFNKIVNNLDEAVARIRYTASQMNAKHLGNEKNWTPERAYRVLTIIEGKPASTDLTVILVGEDLGY